MGVRAKRSGRHTVLILVLVVAFSALACRDPEEVVSVNDPPQPSLRIGLFPEQNLFAQKRRYQPVADYLSKKTGARIELKLLPRYGNIIENFASNKLDGAFLGSFTAALAQKKLRVEAVARPEYADGSSTYHGLVIVRRDSGITQAAQMKGKSFAFVDNATTAGWLLPLHYFKAQGVDDYLSWLAETYFAGSHEGVIYDVLERRADAGSAKNTVLDRLALSDPRISSELMVLARSPSVPENALFITSELDGSLKSKLRDALLMMDREEEGREILEGFGAARFIETAAEDYAVVYSYAEDIGLDLEDYDYIND